MTEPIVADPGAPQTSRVVCFVRPTHLGMTADPALPGDVVRLPAAQAGDCVEGKKAVFVDRGEDAQDPNRELVLDTRERARRDTARRARRSEDLKRIAGVTALVRTPAAPADDGGGASDAGGKGK